MSAMDLHPEPAEAERSTYNDDGDASASDHTQLPTSPPAPRQQSASLDVEDDGSNGHQRHGNHSHADDGGDGERALSPEMTRVESVSPQMTPPAGPSIHPASKPPQVPVPPQPQNEMSVDSQSAADNALRFRPSSGDAARHVAGTPVGAGDMSMSAMLPVRIEERFGAMERRLAAFEGSLGRIEALLIRSELLHQQHQQGGQQHLHASRSRPTSALPPSRRESEDSSAFGASGGGGGSAAFQHLMPSMSVMAAGTTGGRRRMPKGGGLASAGADGAGGPAEPSVLQRSGTFATPRGVPHATASTPRNAPPPLGGRGVATRSFAHKTPRVSAAAAAKRLQQQQLLHQQGHPSFSSQDTGGSNPTPEPSTSPRPIALVLENVNPTESSSYSPHAAASLRVDESAMVPARSPRRGVDVSVPANSVAAALSGEEAESHAMASSIPSLNGADSSMNDASASDGPGNPLSGPPPQQQQQQQQPLGAVRSRKPSSNKSSSLRGRKVSIMTPGEPKAVVFEEGGDDDDGGGDDDGGDGGNDGGGNADALTLSTNRKTTSIGPSALAGSGSSKKKRDRRVSMKIIDFADPDDDEDEHDDDTEATKKASSSPSKQRPLTSNHSQSAMFNKTTSSLDPAKSRRRRSATVLMDDDEHSKDENAFTKCLAQNPPVDSDRIFIYVSDSGYVTISLALMCLAALGIISGTGFDIDAPPPWPLTFFVVLAQLYSVVWMALRGGFVRKMVGDDEIADTHRSIARQYLRTWFVPDLVTSFPIELIFLGWFNAGFFYAMTRHFLRVFRVTSLSRSSNPLLPERPALVFIMLTGLWFFLIVALAVAYQVIEGSEESLATAMYWATATVTSTGYGDITTASETGRIFAIIGMVLSIFLVSLLQAYSTSLLTSRDVVKEDIARKKQTMHSMLQHYGIPWDLQKDVIYTFPAVLDSQREHNFKEMIEGLPPRVTERLEVFIKMRVLQTSPLFASLCDALSHDAAEPIWGELADVMSLRKVPAMEYFVQPGQSVNELLFIQSGVAEVVDMTDDGEVVLQTLRRGMAFGTSWLEDPEAPSRVWKVGAQALQLTEMYSLHQNDFDALLVKHNGARLQLPPNPRLLSGDPEDPTTDEHAWTYASLDDVVSSDSGDASGTDPFDDIAAYRNAFRNANGLSGPRRKSLGAATLQSMMSRSGMSDDGRPPAIDPDDDVMDDSGEATPLESVPQVATTPQSDKATR